MNDSIEEAARAAIRDDVEITCALHEGATVIHRTSERCPLCAANHPDPAKIIAAVHALAHAPAPIAAVYEAIKAMEPITAQLTAANGITTFGHTVEQLRRLGVAKVALEDWLNHPPDPRRRSQPVEPPQVHILKGGIAVCRFSLDVPASWPLGHSWQEESATFDAINCAGCKAWRASKAAGHG